MPRALLALLLLLAACAARAGEVQVAAAANLGPAIQKIAAAFARDTGHRAVVALGSTGKFHAQIVHGAPFEVLLAADEDTPRRLEAEGHGVPRSRFTYAIGRLVLWSPQEGTVDRRGDVLRQPPRGRLALADPRLAPYGAAAIAVLKKMGVHAAWQPHIVMGESVGQAYQFVASGNASLGFVALSQVAEDGRIVRGSGWVVPGNLYPPIRQDALLLKPGAGNAAAQAFLQYMRGNAARAILRRAGYAV
ncbi:molybdate ABC transporter substrate-binding protein [Ramlibacter sp.]|uniref:molybdate ABC transporter substrate-binding protein n=1 Tax=Ramlibacter sp. TaxID=1917967 RepID=UPI0039C9C745